MKKSPIKPWTTKPVGDHGLKLKFTHKPLNSYCISLSFSLLILSLAFDVISHVALIGTTANYTGLGDCWLCGEVQQWNLPLTGVPSSNWSHLKPCSLHSTSAQCRQAGSSLAKPLFQLLPINESATYTGLNHSGANLGNFSSNTTEWVNVTQPM